MGSSTSAVMSPMWIILYQYHRLTIQLKQKVQNTPVCFIPSASHHKNCTLLPVLVLQQLQWLPILKKSNTKLPAVTGSAPSQLNYNTFIVCPPPSLSHTHVCMYAQTSNASTANPMAFAFSHTLVPISGTISPKTSGTLLKYSLLLQRQTQAIYHLQTHFIPISISL